MTWQGSTGWSTATGAQRALGRISSAAHVAVWPMEFKEKKHVELAVANKFMGDLNDFAPQLSRDLVLVGPTVQRKRRTAKLCKQAAIGAN